jgi:hypothetical protein
VGLSAGSHDQSRSSEVARDDGTKIWLKKEDGCEFRLAYRYLNCTQEFAGRAIDEYNRFLNLLFENLEKKGESINPSGIISRVLDFHRTGSVGFIDRSFDEMLDAYEKIWSKYYLSPPLSLKQGFAPSWAESDPKVSNPEMLQTISYIRTHVLYEEKFGSPPPSDIWPLNRFEEQLLRELKSKVGNDERTSEVDPFRELQMPSLNDRVSRFGARVADGVTGRRSGSKVRKPTKRFNPSGSGRSRSTDYFDYGDCSSSDSGSCGD